MLCLEERACLCSAGPISQSLAIFYTDAPGDAAAKFSMLATETDGIMLTQH